MLRMTFTSLRWSIVFARRWRSGTGTASFLDAQRPAFDHFTLQAVLRGVGLFGRHHLDEAETPRFARVRIAHDVAFLHVTVFLKHTGHFLLTQSGMNACHEEICSRVAGSFIILGTGILRNAAARTTCEKDDDYDDQLTNRP